MMVRMMWRAKWTPALPRAQATRPHFQRKREVIHLRVNKFSSREGKNLLPRVKTRAHLGIKASEMGFLYSITHFLVKVDMAETMPALGIKDSTQYKMQCEKAFNIFNSKGWGCWVS